MKKAIPALCGLLLPFLLTSLACSLSSAGGSSAGSGSSSDGSSSGGDAPIPFKAEDCNVPGLPNADLDQSRVYDTNLYCVFQPGGSLNGNAYFSFFYHQDIVDANNSFADWSSDIQDAFENGRLAVYTPDQVVSVLVTPVVYYPNPIVDFQGVHLVSGHFIVVAKGGVSNTSEENAFGFVTAMFTWGEELARTHFPNIK